MQAVYGRMAPLLHTLPGARSVLQSGSDLAWMVTAPELAGVTGAYYSGRKRRNSSKESHDTGRGTELWAASEKLVATG
jgi:protochlorophyllide reductase